MRLVPLNITLIVIPVYSHIVAWYKRNAGAGMGTWERETRASGRRTDGSATLPRRDLAPLLPLPPSTPFNFNHDGLLLLTIIRPIVLQLSSPLSSLGTWDLIFANEVVRSSCYTRRMASHCTWSDNSAVLLYMSKRWLRLCHWSLKKNIFQMCTNKWRLCMFASVNHRYYVTLSIDF